MKPIAQTTVQTDDSESLPVEVLSTPQSKYSSLYALLSNVVFPFLVIRLFLVVIGMVTAYYLLPLINRKQPIFPGTRLSQFPTMLFSMWNRFDSGYYLSIAHDGYQGANTLHSGSNWGFFPFYPLLIHLLASPFGSSWDTYTITGLIISNAAALVAVFYLYRLTMKEFNASIAARAAFYLGLFPMSFYLSAIYPESLFLAFMISSIYYARLHRWWLAGLLGGLATLTRSAGVLLVIAIAWEYWQVLADQYTPLQEASGISMRLREWLRSRFIGFLRALSSWSTWFDLIALALIPTALFLFMLYSKLKVGAFKAYFIAQQYGWNHHTSNPVLLLVQMLQHPLAPSPYDWDFYSLNIISTLMLCVLLVPIFRKLPTIYGLIALLFLIFPLTTGKIDSAARYDLTIFPVYMLLAWWTSQGTVEQQIKRHGLISASSAALLAVGMVLFTLGVYAIA